MTAPSPSAPDQAPTLDIYVLRDNRWHLHGQYPPANKFEAIEEAERLDGQPDIEGVRVTTAKAGGAKGDAEVLVWTSPKLSDVRGGGRKKPMATAAPLAPSVASRRAAATPADREDGAAPSKTPVVARRGVPFFRSKAGALAVAGGIGIIASGAASAMVTDFMRRGFPISTGVATGFAILVFLLAAGLTATILRQQSKSRGESTVTGDAFAVHGTVSDIVGIAPTATVAGSGGMRVDADAAAPVAEETRLTLMRFLEGIVAAIKDVVPRLDANSTLGLNLVVAGAAEALGDSRNLSPIRTRVLVREALGVVGASSEMVEAFVDALPEHREDPRSRAMIECGRSAMDSHLRGDNLPFQGLLDAFRAWQGSPLNAATGERIVTIMVTMVVKPMTLESTQGNFHADVAMHGHDAIVRVVLATHGGHELRHTGDGIMAVFLNPAGAAQAALDIQRAIAAHNVSAGIAPVVVRIGLNAGAAPGQQGDSSENTVQDAFHACSLAGPGQICVTGAIVSLCEGHGFVFREQAAAVPEGGTPLPPVFEMVWQQDQPVELGGV